MIIYMLISGALKSQYNKSDNCLRSKYQEQQKFMLKQVLGRLESKQIRNGISTVQRDAYDSMVWVGSSAYWQFGTAQLFLSIQWKAIP